MVVALVFRSLRWQREQRHPVARQSSSRRNEAFFVHYCSLYFFFFSPDAL